MFRIIRTRTLQQASAQAEVQQQRADHAEQTHTADTERLGDLERALGQAQGALEILRAQQLLDTEDRAALRALLRTARRQTRQADRVFVLFRHGALHSLHATQEAAEAAAEAEGAPRSGWTALKPGAALPPASEVTWRVQALPLNT
ncbi:hypothetical protein [Streptomyces anulatus]|uniref:Uncharacterized protein n=1 Tax=Streptomyces anulatus TaxID=1892 RepID=A0ABZ1ZIK7_STRAQ|nr:hypothetical protein [Streptomyces anulatus]